ncbi:MAG: hypothetical protein AMXMBFR46_15780 [Acidimicrobiia bacterium]
MRAVAEQPGGAVTPRPPAHRAGPLGRYRADGACLGVLALVVYLPLFLSHWGRLNSDTKQYLYLDPGGLLASAPNLWNPRVAGGTVTHQNIGYLWPMGPYYWLTNWFGIPDWVAQRFWMGTIQLAAAAGAYVLFRVLWRDRRAATVGALVYGLSPFVLGHVTGQSALLLPYCALPWLILATRNALRRDPWRWAAVYALIVTTAGSINGSAIFFALLGSMLWVPFAVWGERTATARAGVSAVLRIALLTTLTQLWWLMAYRVAGQYGLPVLEITEPVRQTSSAASAVETLRGLGYWFFYGGDNQGPWLRGFAPPFTQSVALLVVSFATPLACIALGWWSRFRERLFFMGLVVVGVLGSAIAFGGTERSLVGDAFESLSRDSGLVLSLRNTQRAGAMTALGLAGLAAAGITALRPRTPPLARGAGLVIVTTCLLTLVAPWSDAFIAERYDRDEVLPQAWIDTARFLDRTHGRALVVPGIDFASHRWGHAVDPILPGLTDTELMWRELLPLGGVEGADLLSALDQSIQTGTFDPRTIVPAAHALGVTHLVVANDLEIERYRVQRPELVMDALSDPATGLRLVASFGEGYRNVNPGVEIVDQKSMRSRPTQPDTLPQVAVFAVPGATRAHQPVSVTATGAETVVYGDGAGFLAAAAAGLLDADHRPVLSGGDLATWPAARRAVRASGTRHIVTDSNRKRERRFTTLLENDGATQTVAASPISGVASDLTTEEWNGTRTNDQSIVVLRGARRIDASAYGNLVSLLPEDRPTNAFDGDPRTSWRVDPASLRPVFGDRDHFLRIDLGRRVDADHVTVVQPANRFGTRAITAFDIVLDDDAGRRVHVDVDPARAVDPAGTRIALDGHPFSSLELRIPPDEASGAVGVAEIAIPGVRVEELVRLPRDTALSSQTDSSTALAYVLSRQRADAALVDRADPEPAMRRLLVVPAATSFTVSGTAHVAPDAPDVTLDRVFATTGSSTEVTSSERLIGDPGVRASAAVDGDLSTWWSTPLQGVIGQTWTVRTAEARPLGPLTFDFVVDDHHSLPTELEITVDGESHTFAVPRLTPAETLGSQALGARGATARAVFTPPQPIAGRELSVTVKAIEPRTAADLAGNPLVLPVAIAELDTGSGPVARTATTVDLGCRDDLLTIDDQPVAVRVSGDAGHTGRAGLQIEQCTAVPIVLDAGPHIVRTAPGVDTGVDLDLIALVSAEFSSAPGASPVGGPVLHDSSPRSAVVSGRGDAFWVRLDQSANRGWTATATHAGTTRDLGPANPLDFFASGWLVDEGTRGRTELRFTWAPQRAVDLAIAVSVAAVALCIVLVAVRRRRAEPAGARSPAPGAPDGLPCVARAPIGASAGIVIVGALFGSFAVGAALLVYAALAFAAAVPARDGPDGSGPDQAPYRPGPLTVLVRVIPPLALAAAVGLVVAGQVRHDYIHDALWPGHFRTAHLLTLFGVLAMLHLVWSDRATDRRPDQRHHASPS